jgi:hypothetical protein
LTLRKVSYFHFILKETIMAKEAPIATRNRIKKDTVINMLAESNPKREGTLAHARFALYEDGMTVGEYTAAGGRSSDVHYDAAYEYISLTPAEEAVAA